MNITINDILRMGPCASGIRQLYSIVGRPFYKDEPLDIELLVKELSFSDICWVLGKLHKKEILIKLAIFSAEQVLPIYESEHDSNTPRLAIESAKVWVKGPTEENRLKVQLAYPHAYKAVASCVGAAHAAQAANAAAHAAYAAANVTSYSFSTHTTLHASCEAFSIAYAIDKPLYSEMLLDKQIRKYLITLLEE